MRTTTTNANHFFDSWLKMMSGFNNSWNKENSNGLPKKSTEGLNALVQEYAHAIDKSWHRLLEHIPGNPLLSLSSGNLNQDLPVSENLLSYLDYNNRLVFQLTENMIINNVQVFSDNSGFNQLARVLLPGMNGEWFSGLFKETKQMLWPFYHVMALEKKNDEPLKKLLENSLRVLNRVNRLQFLAASASMKALLRAVSEFQKSHDGENKEVSDEFYKTWAVNNEKEFARLFNSSECIEHQVELKRLRLAMSEICKWQTGLFFNQFAQAVSEETDTAFNPVEPVKTEKQSYKTKRKVLA